MKLQGFDVVLAIRLVRPSSTIAVLADELGVVPSQVHAGIKRLEIAGLVAPGTRNTNRRALREFIEHGVRYAFPAQIGKPSRGVPTAHSAEPFASEIDAADAFVWPASQGPNRVNGLAVSPLYPYAAKLAELSPETYRGATLVDVFRVGRVREQALARRELDQLLYPEAAVA